MDSCIKSHFRLKTMPNGAIYPERPYIPDTGEHIRTLPPNDIPMRSADQSDLLLPMNHKGKTTKKPIDGHILAPSYRAAPKISQNKSLPGVIIESLG
jgi:hypothetical protein